MATPDYYENTRLDGTSGYSYGFKKADGLGGFDFYLGKYATGGTGGAAPEANLNQPKAEYGAVIPISFGARRLSPQLIWATEIRGDATSGYFVDFAVSWGYNGDSDPSETAFSKLYANGSKIWSAGAKTMPGGWGVTLYTGTEDQTQDPTLVAQLGAANVPAYRNQMYGVFTNFPINEKWSYQIPGISAEVSGEIGIATAFNDYNPDAISITDDGTTATLTDDADFRPAVTNSGHASGLRYFEVLLNDIPDTSIHYMEIGLATASFNTATDYLNLSPYALALRSQYDIQVNGNEDPEIDRYMGEPNWTATEYEWIDGSRICFAVDLDNGLLWWKLNGNKWSGYLPDGVADWEEGDPTTGLHGFPYATYNPDMAGQELLLAVSLNDSVGESITIKPAEADFVYTPPTGYEPWGGIAGGSAPTSSLIALIQRIGEYAGLDPDADMSFDSAIDDDVTGAVIGANTTFGEFALNLGRWYGFDMYEGDALEFILPIDGATYTLDRTVPAADLLNQGDRAITTTRGEDDSPVVLEGQYIDQTQQFRFNTQRARRILYPVRSTQSHRQMQIAVPVIQTANQAITYLGRAIYRMASQNVLHQFDLGPRHLDITPGSLLGITSGDTAYDVKVTRMEIGPQLRVSINAVNLFTQEDLTLESESGTPLPDYTGVEPVSDVTGTMAATEGADGFSASGTVTGAGPSPITGTMAVTEGADAFAGSGTVAGVPTTDPSYSSVVFLSGFDGTDGATTATEEKSHALTFNGSAQIDTAQSKFGGASLLIGGVSGSYVSAADSADWDFGSGQFTVEAWVYQTAATTDGTTFQTIIGQWNTGSNQRAWWLNVQGSPNALVFDYSTNGSGFVAVPSVLTSASAITLNTWHHVAVDRDASGVLRIYIDGVMVTKVTVSSAFFNSTTQLTIGRDSNNGREWKGWIDEVRITKGVARYASDAGFSVPTAAFPRS